MKTIVLQSQKRPPWPDWLRQCMFSVRTWAQNKGYAYLFLQDELFEGLPRPFLEATDGNILPRTDYGRLLWLRRLHDQGWARAIWIDADVMIFDQSLDFEGDAVGREAWISHARGEGFRVVRKVNNCAMCFRAGSPHLERYLGAAEAKAAASDGPYGRLDFGPDLMTRLHVEAPFPLHPHVAMFSPRIVKAASIGADAALRAHGAVWGDSVYAANLCSSLDLNDETMEAAAKALLAAPSLAHGRGAPPPVEEISLWKGAPAIW